MQGGPSAPVALPDGSSLPVRKLVRPPRRGRKVVLLGDTCNSRAILSMVLYPCQYISNSSHLASKMSCMYQICGPAVT